VSGTRISSAADFPHVAVYQDAGPVFSVAFKNREQRSLGNQMLWMGGIPVAVMVFFGGVVAPAMEIDGYRGTAWGFGMLGAFILPAVMFRIAMGPTRSRRVIELDFRRDRLRVLRNGKEALARELSRLHNLTVEPHPMAQRETREKGGALGPFQKQHCLFGWFGAGGAEKVMLLARWEWPNQDSLFEVRQAVQWARERRGSLRGEDEAQAAGQGAPSGMKPPLD
jgi:hypothetical protein